MPELVSETHQNSATSAFVAFLQALGFGLLVAATVITFAFAAVAAVTIGLVMLAIAGLTQFFRPENRAAAAGWVVEGSAPRHA